MIHFFSLERNVEVRSSSCDSTAKDLLVPVQPAAGKVKRSHHNVAVEEHFVEQVSDGAEGVQGKNGDSGDGDPTLMTKSGQHAWHSCHSRWTYPLQVCFTGVGSNEASSEAVGLGSAREPQSVPLSLTLP